MVGPDSYILAAKNTTRRPGARGGNIRKFSRWSLVGIGSLLGLVLLGFSIVYVCVGHRSRESSSPACVIASGNFGQ